MGHVMLEQPETTNEEDEQRSHTSLAILDDDGIDDLAELGEAVTKGIVGGVPGETSDKQLAGPRDWRKSHG